jgi:hypothetical protein
MSEHDEFSGSTGAAGGVSPEVSAYMSDKAKKRWAAGRAAQSMKEAMAGGEPHPLFPTGQGEPIPQIDWINVCRFEPGRGPIDCPRVFPAMELQSLEDLAGMYGGGRYELRGRSSGPDGAPGPILRYQRFTLDGESLPFAGELAGGAGAAAAAAGGAPAPMDPMMMFLTMQSENAKEARASSDRQMQMIIAMMQMSATQSTQSMQSMAQLMAAAMGSNHGPDAAGLLSAFAQLAPKPPDVAALLSAFAQLSPKTDGSADLEKISKLIEISKAIKPDEDSISSILNGAGQAFAGFAQVAAMAAAAEAEKKRAEAEAANKARTVEQPPAAAEPAQQQQQQAPPAHAQHAQHANGHAPPPPAQRRGGNEAETLAT